MTSTLRDEKFCASGELRINSGTEDNKIVGIAIRFCVRTADHTHSVIAQIFDGRFRQLVFCRAIQHADIGVMRTQQQSRGGAAETSTENGDILILITRVHLTFSVANPSSAKTADKIQNRTMTVFSFQPTNSK